MKYFRISLIIIFFPLVIFSQEVKKVPDQKFFYGIHLGLNLSKIKNDDIDFSYGAKTAIGLYVKGRVMKNLYIKNTFLYSRKGGESLFPNMRLENSYLDINITPQYKLFDQLYINLGFSFSQLLTAQEIILNGKKTRGVEKIDVDGFSSERSVMAGVQIKLQRNINLEFNYFKSLGNGKINNFQLGLIFPLNDKTPKKESFRKLKKRKSKEQIQELKSGTLLIRLKTSQNKINALRERGMSEQADKVEKAQEVENKKIVSAFRDNFKFCNVAFFHSNYSNEVKNKEFNAIFLDDSLMIDESIKIETKKAVFIADFGSLEQDTAKYYSHSGYARDGNWSLKKVDYYYGGTDFGFQALLIRDSNFIQLRSPFPYYSRAIYRSIKKHPEEALFIFPLLLTQDLNYGYTVKRMNSNLNDYFNKVENQ